MNFLHVLVFCCFLAVCVEASLELEVNGHVGGEVSIPCSGNWTAGGVSEHGSVYFCKGVCSRENVLIQSEKRRSALAHEGRYSAEVDGKDGVFNVTIKNLRSADAGPYYCGVGSTLNELHQYQINLIVLDAPTVPQGPLPISTDTPRSGAEAASRGSFSSSSEPATRAPLLSEEKRNKQGVTKLTGTTVVIIISGSLAFLVCGIIPFIFYGHWRRGADGQNRFDGSKDEGECGEQTSEVQLQSVEAKVENECSVQDASQYAAIYQALDPKSLD
ncbi:unnamed protein product [Ophioblennius macclurei]